MIRVLHVVGRQPTGGIGAMLLNLHANIDSRAIQFDYILCSDLPEGAFAKKARALGGRVFLFPELRISRFFELFRMFKLFFTTHKEHELIWLHSPNMAILCCGSARRGRPRKVIVHSHSTKYADSWGKVVRNYVLCLPLPALADYFFACSVAAGKFLFGAKAYREGSVRILPNSINAADYRFSDEKRIRVREMLDLRDLFVVGHVGRLCKEKNHVFLFEIFREIQKLEPRSILLIVGSGELENALKHEVKRKKIQDCVKFLGNREDVSDIMAAMDVFVLPSLYEGLPVSIIEAQAAGLPCVVSDVVTKELAITDLVTYQPLHFTPEAWARHVLQICSRDNCRDRYEEIFRAGYDARQVALSLQEFIKTIV